MVTDRIADQDRFDHLRAVEVKHGRVSMLAVVGYLVTYGRYFVFILKKNTLKSLIFGPKSKVDLI